MAGTTTAGERVERWRTEYQGIRWDVAEGNAPRNAALHAGTENALDAIEAGETAEASVWVAMAQLISFRYRRITS